MLDKSLFIVSRVQRGKICGNYLSHNAETQINLFFKNVICFLKFLYSLESKHKLKQQFKETRSGSEPSFPPQDIYFTQIILTFGITGRLEYYMQRSAQGLIRMEIIMRNLYKNLGSDEMHLLCTNIIILLTLQIARRRKLSSWTYLVPA